MNVIRIHQPRRRDQEILISWSVDPPSALYLKTAFTFRFPDWIDLTVVPEALWWRIAIICLHSHWPLLAPCRVEIPIELRGGEIEFWNRLMASQIATLEALHGSNQSSRQVVVVDGLEKQEWPDGDTQS